MGSATVRADSDVLVTLRALNEYVYCPRLHYFMFVEGVFVESADTVEGAAQHERAARRRAGSGGAAAADEPLPWGTTRELQLADEALGIIGRLDAVEAGSAGWMPVEAKHGPAPRRSAPWEYEGYTLPGDAWLPDQVQICAQALLLRAQGLEVAKGVLYYRKSKTRVEVPITPALEAVTRLVIRRAREAHTGPLPPPLVDSPKCNGCSLNYLCMPDEINVLKAATSERPRRIVPGRPDGGVLYLSTQGSVVRSRGESIIIESPEGEQEAIPLKDLLDLAVFGNVQLTTQALNSLLRHGCTVAYHSFGGQLNGIASPLTTQNPLLRRFQFQRFDDAAFTLRLARRLVQAKILNQRTLLRRNAKSPTSILGEMKRLADAALGAEDRDALMGIEGQAAHLYFQAFGTAIKAAFRPAFDVRGRNRRPPRDPVNALLSFGYALLLRDCVAAAARVGFDPMFGFFHVLRPGRPALALDVMEPFRPLIVDSLVLRAINMGVIQADHFTQAGQACTLTPGGRKRFLSAYERRMNEEIAHPIFGYRISYRRVLEVETRLLARVLEGELDEIQPLTTR